MKHFVKLVTFATVLAVLLQPILAWATANCYNYDGRGSCHTNPYCHETLATSHDYCKQLTSVYPDPGCCSYHLDNYIYGSQNNGICPCANKDTYPVVTNAINTPAELCYKPGGIIAPCNTDIQDGSCEYTPGYNCI
jgi:hypothetical protein